MTETLAPTATETAKPAPKAKAQPHPCKCGVPGCAGVTTKIFAPGHDQKAVGHWTRAVVKAKTHTAEQAITALRETGASEQLVGKLLAAIKRETKNAETAATRKADLDAQRALAKETREKKRAEEKAAKSTPATGDKPETEKMKFAREQAAKVGADNATKAKATSATAEAKANA